MIEAQNKGGLVRQIDLSADSAITRASGPYPSEIAGKQETHELTQYWRILRRHRLKLVLFAVCGAIAGVLIGLPQRPVYQVTTSLEVLTMNDNFMNLKQASPVTTIDSSYDTSEEETQVQLLHSESLIERVLNRLAPEMFQKRPPGPPTWWRSLLRIPEPPVRTEREKQLVKIVRTLKVKATPRTRVIEAVVKSTNPQLAVDFANALTAEYLEQSIEARWKTTAKVGDWLSRELNGERDRLRRSEDDLQAYARDSGLIFSDDTTNVATEKLQQVQTQLTASTNDRINKQARNELAQHSAADSLPDVLNDDNLRESKAAITTLRAQVADLSAVYTPDYSKVKRAAAQLQISEADYDREIAAILERINNDYVEAQRREKLLQSAYDSQIREVTGQDEKTVQYNILKREVDSNRQLYDTMLSQMKESSIASALNASNARVVDPAELPDKPIWPNFPILSALGCVTGLFLGLGVIVIRERADRTLQQPGETQLWTNLPELGTIPTAKVDGEKRFGSVYSAKTLKSRIDEADRNGSSVELITWDRKPSLTAEAFRATLTSILFIGESEKPPKTLALTSPSQGEGKTTIVSNLGIAIAEIQRKVLIVDADLRRPRIHDVFHRDNACGLGDLLRDPDFVPASLESAIQKTDVPGLDILPSGPPTDAAANLLYSPHLRSILDAAKRKYDMILIDTPPMLQMTDARVVGRHADAVVLVARAERTTRDAIVAASQRFLEDRIRVLGTILNNWNPQNTSRGYYGYHHGGYYSSYGKSLSPSARKN